MKIKRSAGIAIIWDNKILMAKPTNASWWERYTPPKGGIEEGESLAEAASRETQEEVGIYIDPKNLKEPIEVEYADKRGKVYKIVYLFEYRINSLSEIGVEYPELPRDMLQKEEVSDARFMSLEQCEKRSLKRYIPYLRSVLS